MRDGSKTRNKLDRCAIELFVEKGVTGTTVKDIAQRAGTAEGTLYRHYESKDAMIDYLFFHFYEVLLKNVRHMFETPASLTKKLEKVVYFFCEQFDEDPILFNFLLLTQHHPLKEKQLTSKDAHQMLKFIFDEGVKNNEIPDRDTNIYASIVLGILLQAALSRIYGRIKRSMMSDQEFLRDTVLRLLEV